jgi:hypothetical protein
MKKTITKTLTVGLFSTIVIILGIHVGSLINYTNSNEYFTIMDDYPGWGEMAFSTIEQLNEKLSNFNESKMFNLNPATGHYYRMSEIGKNIYPDNIFDWLYNKIYLAGFNFNNSEMGYINEDSMTKIHLYTEVCISDANKEYAVQSISLTLKLLDSPSKSNELGSIGFSVSMERPLHRWQILTEQKTIPGRTDMERSESSFTWSYSTPYFDFAPLKHIGMDIEIEPAFFIEPGNYVFEVHSESTVKGWIYGIWVQDLRIISATQEFIIVVI